MEKEQTSTMADQDPKITLLRSKLALMIGRKNCAECDAIKAEHPHALEEPWSTDMSGHHKHIAIVFNNKTLTMHEVATREDAYMRTLQRYPIDCGEKIQLYLDDSLSRDLQQAKTMDWSVLRRSEAITARAIRSEWYYRLVAWVDKIKGGPGEMGSSPSAKMSVMKAKEDANLSSEEIN